MPNLNFSFTPAAGYSDSYIAVAYGNTNPSLPLGQVTVSGYGSVASGTIAISAADAPYKIQIFTKLCTSPVGQLQLAG